MFPKKLHLQSLIECDHFFRYPLEIKRKSLTSISQLRVPWQEILNRNLDFSCVFVEKEDWFGKIVDHEVYLLFGEGQHASEKENSEKKKGCLRATRNSGSKVQYSQSFVSLIFLVSRNGLRRKGWTAGSLQRFYWCTVFRSNTILNYDKCFSPFIFCWTMRRIFSILEKERIAHHKWRVQNYDDATQPFYEELFLCFYSWICLTPK